VVGDRGRSPQQAADEHDQQVHSMPVEDVSDTTLRTRYAGEREDQQRGGQGKHRDQGVVRDHEGQHDREYGGDRLQRPPARTPSRHHHRQYGAGQTQDGHHRADNGHWSAFEDRGGRSVVLHLRERVAGASERPVDAGNAVRERPQGCCAAHQDRPVFPHDMSVRRYAVVRITLPRETPPPGGGNV